MEHARLEMFREQIAQELPELRARDEATLSGELRRAIHASDLSLAQIATQAGITPSLSDDFLTGERTLRSDVLDRVTNVLGYELQKTL